MIVLNEIVQREELILSTRNPTEIYTPVPRTLRGEHPNGDKFFIDVKEMNLPEGTAPEAVKNVSAIFWDEKIYLSWEKSAGVADFYDVVLEDNSDNLVSEVEGYDELNFTFDNSQSSIITNGNTYVLYINKQSRDSYVKSTEVSGTPSDKTPQNLTVDSEGSNSIEVSWDTVIGDVKYYNIYVRQSGSLVKKVSGLTSTSHVITGLEGNQQFDITVTSVSTLGIFESTESDSVTGSTDTTAPAVPTGLQADDVGTLSIDISWDANSEGDLAGYNIYVDSGSGFSKDNGNLVQGESYSITTTKDTEYDIKITAVDTSGNESSYSNTITETTLSRAHLVFNGSDQYVDLGQLGSLGSSEIENGITVEMSFSSSTSGGKAIFGGAKGQNQFETLLFIRLNRITSSNEVGHIDVFLRDDNSTILRVHTTNGVFNNDGTTYRLAVRLDPSNGDINILLNGDEKQVTYDNNNSISDFSDFGLVVIGANVGTGGSVEFYGDRDIDDVRVWSDLRTNSEISNNYQSELSSPNGWATDYPNLFRYYKCNDLSGDQLTEEVNSDHGSLVNNSNDNMWEEGNL